MYKKVKFLIYASFFLFFILSFVILQNTTSQVAQKKEQGKIEQDLVTKTDRYKKLNEERNRRIQEQHTTESQAPYDYTTEPVTVTETTPNQPQVENGNYSATNNNTQNIEEYIPDNDKIETKNSEKSLEQLYLETNGAAAEGYTLCNKFVFDNNNYAIISVDDTRYASEYSNYINRKFYIYKQIDNKLVRIHYLFDKSISKTVDSIPEIQTETNKYGVKITYNVKPQITRTVNSNILLNSGYQFNDIPALTTSPKNTETQEFNKAEN